MALTTTALIQPATTLAAAAAAGVNDIKVAGVTDFAAGQSIIINSGATSS